MSSRVSSIDVRIDVFNKMLDGCNIQMTSRYVKGDGRRAAIAIVRRFELFAHRPKTVNAACRHRPDRSSVRAHGSPSRALAPRPRAACELRG